MNESCKAAMDKVFGLPLNPSSIHTYGRYARKLVEDSKNTILNKFGLSANKSDLRIIFTGSGTEANNLVFTGLPEYIPLVISTEHSSVLRPAENNKMVSIPVDRNGIVDLKYLETSLVKLSARKLLVSIMLANSETGVIQPIREVADLANKFGAIVHCDATQAIGKIEFNADKLGANLYTISAHKFGGPAGLGTLLYNRNIKFTPQILGGGQQYGVRSGTENVPAIVGMAAALENLCLFDKRHLRDRLEDIITQSAPEAIIAGRDVERLPNTSCIILPGVSNELQVMNFDIAGIAISAGSACSSGRVTPSHVLLAMGFNQEMAHSAIRVSLPINVTEQQINRFCEVWLDFYKNCYIEKLEVKNDK